MPYRKEPIIVNQIYHVFNRSIAKQPIFINTRDFKRITKLIDFYRYKNLPLRFSHFQRISYEEKVEIKNTFMIQENLSIDILCYCIMPNHIHFLLRVVKSQGISNFMRNLQNSYSKYFNTKYHRTGSLFQDMFKAVLIETNEQLIHVSKYIHLNPATAYMVEIDKLETYEWSSFKSYLVNDINSLIEDRTVMNFFRTKEDYKSFVLDQATYQRDLDNIKHLMLE